MISREGDRISISGPVTLENVTDLLQEGRALLRAGASHVDLADVSDLDSSLLAMLLAWLRESQNAGHPFRILNAPKGLETLAQLYGVEALLPVDAPR